MAMPIESTRAILMPVFGFPTYLRNSTIHFVMFLYLVPCFLRVTGSLLCRLQAVSKINLPICLYLIALSENCRELDVDEVRVWLVLRNYIWRASWFCPIMLGHSWQWFVRNNWTKNNEDYILIFARYSMSYF